MDASSRSAVLVPRAQRCVRCGARSGAAREPAPGPSGRVASAARRAVTARGCGLVRVVWLPNFRLPALSALSVQLDKAIDLGLRERKRLLLVGGDGDSAVPERPRRVDDRLLDGAVGAAAWD